MKDDDDNNDEDIKNNNNNNRGQTLLESPTSSIMKNKPNRKSRIDY